MDTFARKPFRLRHLEVFHWVMEEDSLTAAARKLGSSQPSVSRDLAEFERLLGYQLFVREGRRVVPTAEARYLHSEVRKSYMCADTLYGLCEEIVAGKAGHIRIAAVPSISLGIVPRAIHQLVREGAQFTATLEVHSRDVIHEMLKQGAFDIAFTVLGGDAEGLDISHLATIEAVCAFHRDSHLGCLEVVSPKDLETEPFIATAAGYISRQKVDEAFLRSGVVPNVVLTTQTGVAACGLIRSGHGVMIIDPLTIAAIRADEIVTRPFAPKVRFDYALAVPLRRGNSVLAGLLGTAVRGLMAEFSTADDELADKDDAFTPTDPRRSDL